MRVQVGPYSLKGVMCSTSMTNDTPNKQTYVLDGQSFVFRQAMDGEQVNAFRTYLTADGATPLVIPIDIDILTDIKTHKVDGQHAEQIYNLQGRPAIGSSNGLYIRRSTEGRSKGKNVKKYLKTN